MKNELAAGFATGETIIPAGDDLSSRLGKEKESGNAEPRTERTSNSGNAPLSPIHQPRHSMKAEETGYGLGINGCDFHNAEVRHMVLPLLLSYLVSF